VVTDFLFSPIPLFFNPVLQKRLCFFCGNISEFKLQGLSPPSKRIGNAELSETFFLKMIRPTALISLLVFRAQK
jgi:hypothetical protein